MEILALAYIPLFLCWGSFLNVVAYRLVHDESFIAPRSRCPDCKHQLAWYDLIPILSWLMLRGSCRYCKQPISRLYPFIECATTLALVLLYIQTPQHYFLAYALFFSALIINIRTDLETMLISRFVSLFLIPLGFILSAYNLLPITLTQSVLGAALGYGVFYITSRLFHLITGKEGMGQGDVELLAFIGSFTGTIGCWITILVGSISGSIIGISIILLLKKDKNTRIPFGPFLAFGAIAYVLYSRQLTALLFGF